MERLRDKICLVTGAAQGIGRTTVEAFLREGAEVIAVDLQEDKLRPLINYPRARTLRLDVTDTSAVLQAASELDRIDVLVNCVGQVPVGTVLEGTTEDLVRCFRANVGSMAETIRAFLPGMLRQRCGSIINVASVVSAMKSVPNRFMYATTKAAVIGLTRSVARDFIEHGIRCNAVSPGTVDTPSLHERIVASGRIEETRQALIARQPMGRLGKPEEVAQIMVMLASDEAPFMTGADLVIDGGLSL
jgi:NAD(P)-dependent dehydrogenase (short-subunit alcohol dehydrogenase family)